MSKSAEQIVALVKDAGVVGAGGRGSPTHLKLQARAETVIVNGSECEPLLYTDKTILKHRAEDVVQGLELAMTAVGARTGVIAINSDDQDGVRAVEKILVSRHSRVRVHLLGNYYPAGDEFLAVYDVTRAVIPEGGTPLDVGVVVLNVLTAVQIYQAVNGMPATQRVVTITGEVRESKVLTVPVGTRYSELIALAGGSTLHEYAVLDGGPMMGNLVTDLETGIGKSTSGIVLLPTDHYVVRMKSLSLGQVMKASMAVGGPSSESTEFCPRHLLGHSIDPDQAMVALDYKMAEPSSSVTKAFLCSGCGICELATDEARFLSPKKIYGEYQRLLVKAGVENPHRRADLAVHSQFENRKLSHPTLVTKLGIGKYVRKIPFGGSPEIQSVRIPIQKHVGARSFASVTLGQNVRRGDLIAATPVDQNGSNYHASIHGKISELSDHFIEITGAAS